MKFKLNPQKHMPQELEFSVFKYGKMITAIDREYVHKLKVDILEKEFFNLLNSSSEQSLSHVPGRGIVRFLSLTSGEELVFRLAKRGGAIRHLLKCSFIRPPGLIWPNTRIFSELTILSKLYADGHPVPKPVASIVLEKLGGLVYQGAVVTEVIPYTKNFLTYCQESLVNERLTEAKSIEICKIAFNAGSIAKNLLEAGVFHPDLHLGNVLVDANLQPFIIDFDKAQKINPKSGIDKFAHKLATRWRRSVLRNAGLFDGNQREIERVFVAGLFGARRAYA